MLVKIWNDSSILYKEIFQDELVEIKPRGFIEMPRSKAITFLGSYRPFQKEGRIEDRGIKPLRLEENAEELAKKYQQPAIYESSDGTKFRTKEGLRLHNESLTVKKEIITSGSDENVRRKKA